MKLSPLRIAAIAGATLALGVVVLAAVAVFMPKGPILAEIERRIEAATQRDLTLGGRVSFSFWPALGFAAEDVALSNPEGFAEAPFVSAKRIVFAVAVTPLIGGKVEVKSLVLEGAEVRLEAKPDGAVNWAFPTEGEGQDQAPTIDDLRLDDVRLVDGRLSFAGPEGGDPIVLEDVDASVGLQSLDAPSALNAEFDYRGERLRLEAELGKPRALLEKGQTPLSARLSSDPLNAQFEGTLDAASAALAGQIEADGASVRRLAAWMGAPLGDGGGFGAFDVRAQLRHEGEATTLDEGAFTLDAINATGAMVIFAREGEKLRVEGALTAPEIDLNAYLPAPTQGQNAPGVDASTAWTTAPLDLSGLKSIDADLRLVAGVLKFQRMTFSDVAMRIGLAGGVADARLARIALYGGSGTARLIADARGDAPRIAAEIDARDVQALPLLTDAIGFKTIEGRGRLVAQIAGAGASQADIMRSLAGTASFAFNDGAIKGFNLASIARTVTAVLSGDAAGSSSSTDFAELAASLRINNGLAVTEDLRLLNPFVRIDGAGLIDIGAQTLDMRLAPRAVSSIEGQGGQANLQGVGVPFRVSGPWARPRFEPAIGDAVRNELRERAREAIAQQDPDSPLGVLGAAIFGRPETPAPAEAPGEASEAEAEPQPAEPEPSVEDRAREALERLIKRD